MVVKRCLFSVVACGVCLLLLSSAASSGQRHPSAFSSQQFAVGNGHPLTEPWVNTGISLFSITLKGIGLSPMASSVASLLSRAADVDSIRAKKNSDLAKYAEFTTSVIADKGIDKSFEIIADPAGLEMTTTGLKLEGVALPAAGAAVAARRGGPVIAAVIVFQLTLTVVKDAMFGEDKNGANEAAQALKDVSTAPAARPEGGTGLREDDDGDD